MLEVEIKVKIEDPEAVCKNFKRLGAELSDPIVQEDQVYFDDHDKYLDSWFGKTVMRIRKQSNETLYTLKKHRTNPLDCEEFEASIEASDDVEKVLESFGFTPIVKVVKTRRKVFLDGINFCLDRVEGLGHFLEAEKIVESGDGEKIQEELLFYIKNNLKIVKLVNIREGYDTLLYKMDTCS